MLRLGNKHSELFIRNQVILMVFAFLLLIPTVPEKLIDNWQIIFITEQLMARNDKGIGPYLQKLGLTHNNASYYSLFTKPNEQMLIPYEDLEKRNDLKDDLGIRHRVGYYLVGLAWLRYENVDQAAAWWSSIPIPWQNVQTYGLVSKSANELILARDLLRVGILMYPEEIDLLIELAQMMHDQFGDEETAVGLYSTANKIGQLEIDHLRAYAELLARVGRLSDAAQVLERAEAQESGNITHYLMLGSLYRRLGNCNRAVYWAERGYTRHPASVSMMAELAEGKFCAGNVDEALIILEEADQYDTQNEALLSAKAKTYLYLGLLEEADASATTLTEIYSSNPVGYKVLGHIAMRRYEWLEAIDYLQKAVSLAPRQVSNWIALGDSYAGASQVMSARSAYLEAMKLDIQDLFKDDIRQKLLDLKK